MSEIDKAILYLIAGILTAVLFAAICALGKYIGS